jgi:hypothetical protein
MTMKTWITLFFATLTMWAAIAAANALSVALKLSSDNAHSIGFLAGLAGFYCGVVFLWKYEGRQ